MKPLSPEQLLIIADELAAHRTVTDTAANADEVRSYSALCAAAAIPGARIEGVAVFDSPAAAADALAHGIMRLEPLRSGNRAFAAAAREVYVRWAHESS